MDTQNPVTHGGQPDNVEDALARFRRVYRSDLRAGRRRELKEYLQIVPGFDSAVAKDFANLRLEDAPVSVAPSSSGIIEQAKDQESRLRIIEEFARGGMGAIFRARDEVLGRDLAVKVAYSGLPTLLGDLAAGDSISPQMRRFLVEAQITAQLGHPGVVPVHELGVDSEGCPYFSMKLVRGLTLSEVFKLLQDGKDGWNLTRAIQVFQRICEPLAFAHSRNVIHRDIKPANVMVGTFGEVYLMDWGVAKVLTESDVTSHTLLESLASLQKAADENEADSDDPLTVMGAVLGTPSYMPPEQARGLIDELNERSDVYSIGAMLYELLAGHPPYAEPDERHTAADILAAIRSGPPTPIHKVDPKVDPELESIAMRAMARVPADRYPTASALADDLHRWLDGRVVSAHRGGSFLELKKWILRNKGEAVAIGVAIGLFIAGAVTITVQERQNALDILKEKTSRAISRDDASRARTEANTASSARDTAMAAAERARMEAEGNLLCARALNLMDVDRSLALQLAVEGARRAPGASAREILYATLEGHREVERLRGHDAYVVAAKWSPDGRRLASFEDGTVAILWDLDAGGILHRLDLHEERILSLDWSPDGGYLVTSSQDGDAPIWSVEDGTCLFTLKGHRGPVSRAVFGPAGRQVATVSEDGTAWIWQTETGKVLQVLRGHDGPVRGVAFHPDGSRVLTSGLDLTARIWDTGSGAESLRVRTSDLVPDRKIDLVVFQERAVKNHDVCLFSEDGSEFLTWHERGELRIFDTSTGRRTHVIPEGAGMPRLVNSGRSIAVRDSVDSGVTIRNIETFEVEASVADVMSSQFDVSATGHWLTWIKRKAFTGEVVSLRTGSPDGSLPHSYSVTGVTFSPDGKRVATTSCDQTVRIWEMEAPDEFHGVAGISGASISPDAGMAVFSPEDGEGRILEAVDSKTGKKLWWFNARGVITSTSYGGGGKRIAVATSDRLTVLDARTGATLDEIDGPLWTDHAKRRKVRLSLNGRRVMLPDMHVIDLEAKKVVRAGPLGDGLPYFDHKMGADGRTMVVANRDRRFATYFDVDSGKELVRLLGHSGYVVYVAVSPDGALLASTALDRSVRIWDATTGETVAVNRTLPMKENTVEFSPDGRFVIVRSPSTGSFILEAKTGKLFARVQRRNRKEVDLWFAPDGTGFFTHEDRGPVRRWSLEPLSVAERYVPDEMEPDLWRQYGVGDAEEMDEYEMAWLARHPTAAGLAAMGFRLLGDEDDESAELWFRAAVETRKRDPIGHYGLACLHAYRSANGGGADEADSAFEALEAALEAGWSDLEALQQSEHLAALREDARFEELLMDR